jgi:septal ring factor EnvC (AmiA/AmiB activator)
MTDIATAMRVLMDSADELDRISKQLVETEGQLAPLEADLTTFVQDFTVALWLAHIDREEKHPPEKTREALAHRAFNRDKYHQILTLRASRGRSKARLSDLREIVAAQRSIVSAAKTEIDALESGPQPQWSGSREFPRG